MTRQAPQESFFLRTAGGSTDGAVNGSVTPVELLYTAARRLQVARIIVTIEDNGNFSADNYGGVSTLSNGIEFEHVRNGTTIDLLDGQPIKSVVDWSIHSYDLDYHAFGSGNNYVNVRWSFNKAGASMFFELGDQLIIRINDDLTGLVAHQFFVQGVLSQNPKVRNY